MQVGPSWAKLGPRCAKLGQVGAKLGQKTKKTNLTGQGTGSAVFFIAVFGSALLLQAAAASASIGFHVVFYVFIWFSYGFEMSSLSFHMFSYGIPLEII